MTTDQDRPATDGTGALEQDKKVPGGEHGHPFNVVSPDEPERARPSWGVQLETLHEAARAAYAAGLNIVPVAHDGSKMPDSSLLGGKWKDRQTRRTVLLEIDRWFTLTATGKVLTTGLGAIGGAISGGLELFEFDDWETYHQFLDRARAVGLGEMVERIRSGREEQTPGGGIHWYYRCDDVRGNTPLAQRPGPPTQSGKPTAKPLIETRGEGGYMVMAPSFNGVHPSGRPYRLVCGAADFRSIVVISAEERDALWELARSFDEMPKKVAPKNEVRKPTTTRDADEGILPGDDFNDRATWKEVLEPHGWSEVFSRGDTTYWLRPGKDKGVSASTNHAGSDLLYPTFRTSRRHFLRISPDLG
jgi:Bifunctional DNA primase/polymerase, N-terminal